MKDIKLTDPVFNESQGWVEGDKEQPAEWRLMEKLASIEHDRWADWQKYVHQKLTYSEYKKDGKNWACYILDPSDYEHWETQIDKGYKELSEKEKESDREQVRRYLPIIQQELQAQKKQILEKIELETKRISSILDETLPFDIIKNRVRLVLEDIINKVKDI